MSSAFIKALASAAVAACVVFAGDATLPRLRAQVADDSSFAAASIKPNKSGEGATALGFRRGGRFSAINETLFRLISEAYAGSFQLARFQVVGGPGWIDSDRFDVDAIAEGDPTTEQRRAMLRRLLAERFTLAVRSEVRQLQLYDLIRASKDEKLGSSLRPSAVDCAALRAAAGDAPVPIAPGQTRPCVKRFGQRQVSGEGMTIAELASVLARYLNRTVVDRTALKGGFDWTLDWTPEAQSADLDRLSIFTAIQEQLGLKLEPHNGPVEVLIIESVDRPTPD